MLHLRAEMDDRRTGKSLFSCHAALGTRSATKKGGASMSVTKFEKGDGVGIKDKPEARGTVESVSGDGAVVTVRWHDLADIRTFINPSALVRSSG